MPQDKSALKDKLKVEKGDLETKLTSLTDFLVSPDFYTIDNDHKLLLIRQLGLMKAYHNVLDLRINKL